MKRLNTVNKVPDAILTSDWHLREDTPICRIDDFEQAQWNKVKFVSQLQKQYNCPVLHAGDLFHHWKPSPFLLTKTIEYLPAEFYTVLGQHDIPQHNLELKYKSGVYTLYKAGKLTILSYCHFGEEPSKDSLSFVITGKKILVWHHLTYQIKPFPDAKYGMATGILMKYKDYDLILTGDNHIPFVEKYENRILVNPGSLTRQTAAQISHKPRVYLWYAETNSVEPVFLPIEEDVISKEHLEESEKRDERIMAFVSRLNTNWNIELSFEDNLESLFTSNNVNPKIKSIIYKILHP